MDPEIVALLAAGIPATVAAATYVAAEIIKTVRAGRDRRGDAIGRVLDALEKVPAAEARPWIVRRYSLPDIEIAQTVTRLFDVLPKREYPLVFWLGLQAVELAYEYRDGRVEVAAEMTTRLMLWRRDPKKMRAWFRKQYAIAPEGEMVLVSTLNSELATTAS